MAEIPRGCRRLVCPDDMAAWEILMDFLQGECWMGTLEGESPRADSGHPRVSLVDFPESKTNCFEMNAGDTSELD